MLTIKSSITCTLTIIILAICSNSYSQVNTNTGFIHKMTNYTTITEVPKFQLSQNYTNSFGNRFLKDQIYNMRKNDLIYSLKFESKNHNNPAFLHDISRWLVIDNLKLGDPRITEPRINFVILNVKFERIHRNR